MEAAEIIEKITGAGGRIWLEGPKVRARVPEHLRPLLSTIYANKAELMAELARRTASMPPLSRQPQVVAGADDFDPLRPAFVEWFDSRVWLDSTAVGVGITNPRWSAGVTGLYADFCRWMFARAQVPPAMTAFRHLLEELCFGILVVHGEQLVPNVALKEDVAAMEAQELERKAPVSTSSKRST